MLRTRQFLPALLLSFTVSTASMAASFAFEAEDSDNRLTQLVEVIGQSDASNGKAIMLQPNTEISMVKFSLDGVAKKASAQGMATLKLRQKFLADLPTANVALNVYVNNVLVENFSVDTVNYQNFTIGFAADLLRSNGNNVLKLVAVRDKPSTSSNTGFALLDKVTLTVPSAHQQDDPKITDNGSSPGITAPQEMTAFKTGRTISHKTAKIKLPAFNKSVVLAEMQSSYGRDTSNIRTNARYPDSIDIQVEEEQSRDKELSHTKENVGIFARYPGPILSAKKEIVGESGMVSATQSTRNKVHTLRLTQRYKNPVVVMKVVSKNDAAPVHVRVLKTNNNIVQYRLEEWDYLDGKHGKENIHYMALEAGEHLLMNTLPVGIQTVSVCAGTLKVAPRQRLPHRACSIKSSIPNDSVVLTQVASANSNIALSTRLKHQQNYFVVNLQGQETYHHLPLNKTSPETVHYIAVEQTGQ